MRISHSLLALTLPLLGAGALASCASTKPTAAGGAGSLTVTVRNRLAQARPAETVSIPATHLQALLTEFGAENLLVRDEQTGKFIVSQTVDTDGNGTVDELLFQVASAAGGTRTFGVLGQSDGAARQPQSELTTYSRFAPERTDDYAWENDRVAFRTYGPEAERMVVAQEKGGTLTSGMDCWLKRVSYPVIDKWYGNYPADHRYYHVDRGEGYDPYHVGDSRGFAGTGVWDNDSLYVSRNFVSYRRLAIGPIRTLFELSYAPWSANGRTVQEKKIISLDLGSNLTRFEEQISADKPLPNLAIGTTLHAEPKGVRGEIKAEPRQGWFRYWEPMDDAQLGTGVVLAPQAIQGWQDRRSKTKDQSHLLVMATPTDGRLVYYAGFGWTKSGQFATATTWDDYLRDFAQRLASPLEVQVK
ncbi:DUF4861 domain-containing protein [Hymenobacter lapidiphilus]|uniref:DUF4861 domain-containing protein n=1 Tax=Hymenobacter lapidiphilus TaxID=2608003 RepID=A0A7Y7PQ49_9BACT|nr:DUF4861 domain-containing protein [Hymenobacter lapidiphilus]NVO31850.1 DUF4861 domain-containing protein [Hymenobacter lapidiphilus]